jgi:hypothetical protein
LVDGDLVVGGWVGDHPGTVVALPPILDGFDERGLTPVTASELLSVG